MWKASLHPLSLVPVLGLNQFSSTVVQVLVSSDSVVCWAYPKVGSSSISTIACSARSTHWGGVTSLGLRWPLKTALVMFSVEDRCSYVTKLSESRISNEILKVIIIYPKIMKIFKKGSSNLQELCRAVILNCDPLIQFLMWWPQPWDYFHYCFITVILLLLWIVV